MTEQIGQGDQNIIRRTGQLGQNIRDRTDRTGRPDHHNKNRTAGRTELGIRMLGLDTWERQAGSKQQELENPGKPDSTAGTEQPNGTVRIVRSGQERKQNGHSMTARKDSWDRTTGRGNSCRTAMTKSLHRHEMGTGHLVWTGQADGSARKGQRGQDGQNMGGQPGQDGRDRTAGK